MIGSADWTAHQLAVTQLQDTAHASLAWFRTDDTGPDPLRAYIPGDTEPAPAELRSLGGASHRATIHRRRRSQPREVAVSATTVGSTAGERMTLLGKRFAGWKYRVVKQKVRYPDGTTEVVYGIHEFYTEPDGWSSDPAHVVACSVDALRVELDRMITALEMEVIVDD